MSLFFGILKIRFYGHELHSVSDEFGRTWRKAIVADFNEASRYFPDG
jgi:hypothetical protein